MKDAVTVSRVIPIGSSAKMDLSYRRRKPMKQIGNLAVVCARRSEVLLQVYNGQVCVYVGHGPNRTVLSAACDDDTELNRMIYELNFGKYRQETAA